MLRGKVDDGCRHGWFSHRPSGLHPPRDAGAGLHSFVERADGFRIENPFRRPVDFRVEGWFIVAAGGGRVARLPIFLSPLHVSRVVASLLRGVPDSLRRPISPALRRESWAIAQDLKDHRRRLLGRHHPTAAAVEQLMLEIRRDVPRLARRARVLSGALPLRRRDSFSCGGDRSGIRRKNHAVVARERWTGAPVSNSPLAGADGALARSLLADGRFLSQPRSNADEPSGRCSAEAGVRAAKRQARETSRQPDEPRHAPPVRRQVD